MTETSMGDNHKGQFAAWQYIGEHLAREHARLLADLRYVTEQRAKLDAEVTAFLRDAYGLDAHATPVTLDTERGLLVTPDAPPDATPADAPDAALDPYPPSAPPSSSSATAADAPGPADAEMRGAGSQ